MTLEKKLRYGVVGAAVLGTAVGAYLIRARYGAPAYADVATSPQAIASVDGAPSVPGLCVLSQSAVYANAKIGMAATDSYRELARQLRAQLAPAQQVVREGYTAETRKV